MNNFIHKLLGRHTQSEPLVRPRMRSRFEPIAGFSDRESTGLEQDAFAQYSDPLPKAFETEKNPQVKRERAFPQTAKGLSEDKPAAKYTEPRAQKGEADYKQPERLPLSPKTTEPLSTAKSIIRPVQSNPSSELPRLPVKHFPGNELPRENAPLSSDETYPVSSAEKRASEQEEIKEKASPLNPIDPSNNLRWQKENHNNEKTVPANAFFVKSAAEENQLVQPALKKFNQSEIEASAKNQRGILNFPSQREKRSFSLLKNQPSPTIKINIGRIEVRAMVQKEPPAPVRKKTSSKPNMSLEDYLKTRK